jgi:hypothetical protein
MQSIKFKFWLPVMLLTCFQANGFAGLRPTIVQDTVRKLRFLDEFEVPHNFTFENTTVGGLSGIDYSPEDDIYYTMSDDRSIVNSARFYSFKMINNGTDIDTIIFQDVVKLLRPGVQKPYPSHKLFPAIAPDPESIRFNPKKKQLYWSNEGEYVIEDNVRVHPSINIMRLDGQVIDSLSLPLNLKMQSSEKGPRRNSTIEGLAFADDYSKLLFCLEEPLYEDGPSADVHHTDSYVRIYRGNLKQDGSWEQFAYKLDPVFHAPEKDTDLRINGVSEILALSAEKLLVVERSFTTGRLTCTIKVFIADLSHADNVSSLPSLKRPAKFNPIKKHLVLNMDYLGIYIDNIEGFTFGPTLPNGHRTLVFVADNNFKSRQKTQILWFEIIP